MVDLFVSEDNLLGTHSEDYCNPIVVSETNLISQHQEEPTNFILVSEQNLFGGPLNNVIGVASGNAIKLLSQGLI